MQKKKKKELGGGEVGGFLFKKPHASIVWSVDVQLICSIWTIGLTLPTTSNVEHEHKAPRRHASFVAETMATKQYRYKHD